MRLNYLNLQAVGHFTNNEIKLDKTKNFQIIYGSNEAGKSTTLRSINYLLYGFPSRTNDSFLHGNQLKVIGEISNSKQDTLRFIRRKGNKNTLLDIDENVLNDNILNNYLDGISQTNFLNMFALNHERLREGAESLLSSGGSLSESIFAASSGISLLRKTLTSFDKEAGELFKANATKPKINDLEKQVKELKSKINEHQLKIQTFKELENNYNESKENIEDLENEIKLANSLERKLMRIKQILPKYAEYKDNYQELEKLKDIPDLKENIGELLNFLENDLNRAFNDKKEKEEQYLENENEIKKLIIFDELLEHATLINTRYKEVENYKTNIAKVSKLEGEKLQLKNQAEILLKEINPNYDNLDEINNYRLSTEQKATIRQLCKNKALLVQSLSDIEVNYKQVLKELEQKNKQLETINNPVDTKKLDVIIDKIKRSGFIEEQLEKLIKDSLLKEKAIEMENDSLPLWKGSYQELISLEVPNLITTLNKFEKEYGDINQKLQNIKEQLKKEQDNINKYEKQVQKLEMLAIIPTEIDLLTSRQNRNQGWQLIKKTLQKTNINKNELISYVNETDLVEVYESDIIKADDIVDTMRKEAVKVGEKNKLLTDIESANNQIVILKAEQNDLLNQMETWENKWLELWKPSRIIPITPMEMKEWLSKVEKIKQMINEYKLLLQNINELENQKNIFKEELTIELSKHEVVINNSELEEMLDIAISYCKENQDILIKRNNLENSILEINQNIDIITNKKSDLETKVHNWQEAWEIATIKTGITKDMLVEVAESLLNLYEKGVQAYDDYIKIEKEQTIIEQQIISYNDKVEKLLKLIKVDSNNQSFDIVIENLNNELQNTIKNQSKKESLNNQKIQLEKQLKKVSEIIKDTEKKINDLIQESNCDNIEQLRDLEKKFIYKKNITNEIINLKKTMFEIGGGLSFEQLVEEVSNCQIDDIEAKLLENDLKLKNMNKELAEQQQIYGINKKEFEQKLQGSNTIAITAKQELESVITQMAVATEQYIQLKLASILLQKGVEYYRNVNQSPILNKASDIFARLTLQSFDGLVVDYDKNDEPILMGIRKNGNKISIESMSDGTADQLYLALRIASIEKYVIDSEPIPFIVDDILINFDDNRAKETLKVLLELSQYTQIIFFTHHSRLLDIMKNNISSDGYQIIELNQDKVIDNSLNKELIGV